MRVVSIIVLLLLFCFQNIFAGENLLYVSPSIDAQAKNFDYRERIILRNCQDILANINKIKVSERQLYYAKEKLENSKSEIERLFWYLRALKISFKTLEIKADSLEKIITIEKELENFSNETDNDNTLTLSKRLKNILSVKMRDNHVLNNILKNSIRKKRLEKKVKEIQIKYPKRAYKEILIKLIKNYNRLDASCL